MSMDEFKEAWDKGQSKSTSGLRLPPEKATTTVTKLKKRMQHDFLIQMLTYGVIIVLLCITTNNPLSFEIAVFTGLGLGFQALYFNRRFLRFYYGVDRYDLAVVPNLRKITGNLELHVAVYRTYIFCSFPLAALILLLLIQEKFLEVYPGKTPGFRLSLDLPWFLLCVVLLLSQVLIYPLVNRHLARHYGSYIETLKGLIEPTS